MKVSSFPAAATVVLGLLFFGIVPPSKEVTATHHDQSATDNTKDNDHLKERSITNEAGIKPEASLFLPGAPVAALNDHQRRFHMYNMNRKLDLSSCEDSPLKVLTGKPPPKACAFISKKPNLRCKGRMVKSHCPIACGVCAKFGTADSEGTFIFQGAKTNCAWLHDLITPSTLTELSYWCKFDSLRATCRETCGFFCVDEPEQSNAPSLSPSNLPSSSPTTCSDKITSIINEQFGDVVKGPPQEQALAWLVEDMANNECDDEAKIMQRYILAVLYFSTGGNDWDNTNGWLVSASECEWEGLLCNDNQHVRLLSLSNNNLNGKIPAELSSLDNLGRLALDRNKLSGSIPSRIFQLPKLEYLYLASNDLTGKIPDNFGGSSSLNSITLDDNLLTGTIPDITGDSLQSIRALTLHKNKLSGPVPEGICALRSKNPIQFHHLFADCAPPDNAQNPCPSGCCTDCAVGKGLP